MLQLITVPSDDAIKSHSPEKPSPTSEQVLVGPLVIFPTIDKVDAATCLKLTPLGTFILHGPTTFPPKGLIGCLSVQTSNPVSELKAAGNKLIQFNVSKTNNGKFNINSTMIRKVIKISDQVTIKRAILKLQTSLRNAKLIHKETFIEQIKLGVIETYVATKRTCLIFIPVHIHHQLRLNRTPSSIRRESECETKTVKPDNKVVLSDDYDLPVVYPELSFLDANVLLSDRPLGHFLLHGPVNQMDSVMTISVHVAEQKPKNSSSVFNAKQEESFVSRFRVQKTEIRSYILRDIFRSTDHICGQTVPLLLGGLHGYLVEHKLIKRQMELKPINAVSSTYTPIVAIETTQKNN